MDELGKEIDLDMWMSDQWPQCRSMQEQLHLLQQRGHKHLPHLKKGHLLQLGHLQQRGQLMLFKDELNGVYSGGYASEW